MNPQIPRTLFLFTNPKDELLRAVHAGEDADTALHGLNHLQGAEHRAVHPTALSSLLLVPQLLRYDVIFTQDHLLLGYAVSRCAQLFGLRTTWLYLAMNASTLMRRHAAHPVRLFLLKRFWASYARIICISSEQRQDFMRIGIPPERLIFIPFGVDAEYFTPALEYREREVIASIGRDAGRDYPTLCEAAKRIDRPFVIVAGHGNIPADMPLPPNVSVLYDRKLSEIRDLYAHTLLVAVVSKDAAVPDGSDCSGQTVILDALAAGKAVVATRRSWIADYLIHDQDLIVVEPHDPDALARAIEALLRDPQKRERLAASGHAKVVTRYTTRAFAASLETLIRSLT